jgi:hypothetical protein
LPWNARQQNVHCSAANNAGARQIRLLDHGTVKTDKGTPMSFEVNGRQYVAIASGASAGARSRLINTPELKEQRNATVLYVFGL